jgi:hypothetical protein
MFQDPWKALVVNLVNQQVLPATEIQKDFSFWTPQGGKSEEFIVEQVEETTEGGVQAEMDQPYFETAENPEEIDI